MLRWWPKIFAWPSRPGKTTFGVGLSTDFSVPSNLSPPEVARFILKKEGRFDSRGNLRVYTLPSGDGGGTFEVAGINDRYHPAAARKLRSYIAQDRHSEAENFAVDYLLKYTDQVSTWHPDTRVRAFLRDCCFNRGAGGTAAMLQWALKFAGTYLGELDRHVGPGTKRAAARHSAEDLLPRLLLARQWYERAHAGRSEASKFWPGLLNRWVDAYQLAMGMGDPYQNLR